MITLYMDNFRGFKDAYLPLKDVNFFVGENSTGKTSVMALIAVFSSYKFWETYDFSTEFGIDLGLFNDINAQTDEFTIGFYSDNSIGQTDENRGDYPRLNVKIPNALLISFIRNEDGTAKVANLSLWFAEFNFYFKIEIIKNSYLFSYAEYRNSKEAFNALLSNANEPSETEAEKFWDGATSLKQANSIKDFFSFIRSINSSPKMQHNYLFALLYIQGFSILRNLTWIAPIRTKPQRIYERTIIDFSPDGEHIPFILNQLSEIGDTGKKTLEQLGSFGKSSGLFSKLSVKRYGKERNAPFEIQVEIGGATHKITNVGYGVSQILPLIVDILTRIGSDWFLIQQPEVHLHPKAQSTVGEFIYNQASEYEKKFIIETHSDFLVDRFRLSMRKSKKKVETQVVYFQHTENGNTIHLLPIDDEGRYPEEQPDGFRDFFINEAITMMEI